jgi:hypothetical protein
MSLAQLVHDLNQFLQIPDSGEKTPSQPLPNCTANLEFNWETADSFSSPDAPPLLKDFGLRPGLERLFGSLPSLALSLSASNPSPFGDVKINTSQSKSFSISNSSGCDVYISSSGTPSGFTVFPTSTTISGNGSYSFTVTFTPTFEQNYSGYINFSGGSSSTSAYVSGRGVK